MARRIKVGEVGERFENSNEQLEPDHHDPSRHALQSDHLPHPGDLQYPGEALAAVSEVPRPSRFHPFESSWNSPSHCHSPHSVEPHSSRNTELPSGKVATLQRKIWDKWSAVNVTQNSSAASVASDTQHGFSFPGLQAFHTLRRYTSEILTPVPGL